MGELLAKASVRTYSLARAEGGGISHTAIREIIENLLHANCASGTVSILNGGRTIVVSDQGPGIRDKEKAMLPGFTTAPEWMRQYIRGVGSGFLVAGESMGRVDGNVRIDDNLDGGAVVTLEVPSPEVSTAGTGGSPVSAFAQPVHPDLPDRQKRVLLILAEGRQVGPTALAREVGVSLATAHRDMSRLEALGLVQYLGKGKRTLTADGLEHVRSLFRR